MSDHEPPSSDRELGDRELSRELRLFDRACSGEKDGEFWSKLSHLLRTSPGARDRYLRYHAMHADLFRKVRAAKIRQRAALQLHAAGTESPSDLADQVAVPRAFSAWRVPLLALAAAASLLVAAFWPGLPQPSRPVDLGPGERHTAETNAAASGTGWRWPGAVATIRRVEKARWAASGRALRIEDYLTAGEAIEIAEGLVEVEFRQGAVVVLEGPARLVVESKDLASLHEGRMAAVVAPWAVGFRVNTPDLDVIDHGTEFAISVGAPRTASQGNGDASRVSVVVTEGEVEVLHAADGGAGKRLRAGEGVRSDGQRPDAAEDAAARQLADLLPSRPEIKNAVVVGDRWLDWVPGTDGAPRREGAWRHYTNGRGPFGEPALYEELIWDKNTRSYRSPRWQAGDESELIVRVHREGGHPGKGADQSSDRLDHYSIAAFTVPEAGRYRIEAGWLERPEPKRWDLDHVLDIAVHVNDGPILLHKYCNRQCFATISGPLGELAAGDVIYAGVGPSGVDHSDRFRWSFFIVREVAGNKSL